MIYGAVFNSDASMVLTFGRSKSARLWDAATSRPLGEPFSHDQEIFAAAFLPGRPVIATASRDRDRPALVRSLARYPVHPPVSMTK